MLGKIVFAVLFLTSVSSSSQIKGVVKDSITGKSIPFVSIWVENENNGTTSEEDGTFSVNVSEKSKNLIFSALGYDKKIIKVSKVSEVYLKQIPYQLEEIIISKRKETKQIEIGKTDNEILFPAEELLGKDFIVSVNKGVNKTAFNVTKFNLKIPEKGIFVGFEKLIIESNKIEEIVKNVNSNTTQTQKIYYPFVLYNYVERAYLYTFSGGKWIRKTNEKDADSKQTIKIYEPAINLILTN